MDLVFGRPRAADGDVVYDRCTEEFVFLRDKGDLAAQGLQFEVAHVDAVHFHGAFGGVVKARNQIHKAGLAAARRTDDRERFAGPDFKINAAQHLDGGAGVGAGGRVSEAHVFKCNGAVRFVIGVVRGFAGGAVRRAVRLTVRVERAERFLVERPVLDHRVRIEDLPDAFRGSSAAGEGLEDHREHHHAVQDLRDVRDRRHDFAGLHAARLHLDGADPDEGDGGQVENDVHDRPQERHEDEHAQLGVHEGGVRRIKTRRLAVLLDEGLDDAGAVDVFLDDAVEPVDPSLQEGEERVGLPEDKADVEQDERERAGDDHQEVHVEAHQGDRADDHEHQAADEAAHELLDESLHLRDIVGDAGDERTGREGVGLLEREVHDLIEAFFTDGVAEVLAAQVGHGAAEHAKEPSREDDQDHLDADGTDQRQIGRAVAVQSEDAVVDDVGHQPRLDHVHGDLGDHKGCCEDREDPVPAHVLEHERFLSYLQHNDTKVCAILESKNALQKK